MPELDTIAAFWDWWAGSGASRFAQAIANRGEFGALPGEISQLVDQIDPGLTWELAPGKHAEHRLCVTAGGKADLRPLAERWLRAGPQPDVTWEFAAARLADPAALTNRLDFGGRTLNLSETRLAVAVDEGRLEVDVQVFHPLFVAMPPDERYQVTFLVLDWLLGEDDIERWVGNIEAVTSEPRDSLPCAELVDVVRALAVAHPAPSWVVGGGTDPAGYRVMVSGLRPLRWIDFPLYDQHLAISVPYAGQRPDLLPLPDALAALGDMEDELIELLSADAEFVASVTTRGVRVLHFYANSAGRSAIAAQDWVRRHPGVDVTVAHDPGWSAVQFISHGRTRT